jgi:radical SAM protein with 4Fe4S-binding SPASM domain
MKRTFIKIDERYNFRSMFDSEKGTYIRSGVYKNGIETSINPFRATFPHLIDIGIMGHCSHGISGLCEAAGIGCYQNGRDQIEPNMKLQYFERIVKECKGKVDQFALGGRGDPDEHENFEDILKVCLENYIVPNYTTSGYTFNEEKAKLSKEYCGAVAVSWYRNDYTLNAIELLRKYEVKTNIHYVLGNNTIDEAIQRIKDHSFPKVNAIIFLLHKPQGLGSQANVLKPNDLRLKEFFELLTKENYYRFGVDSCTIPGMINYSKDYDINSLDTCEAARFSCYISAEMKMVPCSFDTTGKHEVDLRNYSIQKVFDSETFEDFRNKLKFSCLTCNDREDCLGGCSLMPEIVLCQRSTKNKIV